MKVLFVLPAERGSGEAITCVHMADGLVAHGHEILFLSSAFATRFFPGRFARDVRGLGADGPANRRTWDAAIREFRPEAVVFADYPLLFFRGGATPLGEEPGWQESLESLDACLVTLDHFGFAQEAMGMFFGPPHLSYHYQEFPAIPQRMGILLPCPMHEPGPVDGRRGRPFRYWEVPLELSEGNRRAVRSRYTRKEGDFLVFYSVSNWAWQQAEDMNLPFYHYLGAILDLYLQDLPRPVTVVSVNNGSLLHTPYESSVQFVNLDPIPMSEFEELLLGSDLFLTDNGVSISLGKAVCGLQACAALKNSFPLIELADRLNEGAVRDFVFEMENKRIGTVFPFNVFPIGMTGELERIILYRNNSVTSAFRALEVFGDIDTKRRLHSLLTDAGDRASLRAAQWKYVTGLRRLGDGTQVLQELVEGTRASGVS
jgi:hypothetical protein